MMAIASKRRAPRSVSGTQSAYSLENSPPTPTPKIRRALREVVEAVAVFGKLRAAGTQPTGLDADPHMADGLKLN